MKHNPPFLCEYRHGGSTYGCEIGGDSWEEAEAHLKSIGANGRIIGSDVSRVPVNALTLPFAGLYTRAVVALRNLFDSYPR